MEVRIKRVDELYDKVANKRKFVATTEVLREGQQIEDQVIRRVPNDPIFVRSIYKEYLSLLGDRAKDPADFERLVGKSRTAAEAQLNKGHGDQTLESETPFDEFSNTLYKRIIDYMAEEKNTLEEDARAIGVSVPRGADTQVSPSAERIVEDKLNSP